MVNELDKPNKKSLRVEELISDLKQAQSGLMIEDQLRNDVRINSELIKESPPRSGIERAGWAVVAFGNCIAALALTSMGWEDRSLLLLAVSGGAWVLCYKLFRKTFRR